MKSGTTIFTDEELQKYNISPITPTTTITNPPESEEQSTIDFNEYLRSKNFFFDKQTIENYLLSLKVNPFIILTGNSGTGKTKLSQLFAEYLFLKESPTKNNYTIVPVGSNWTENRNIIGYYNVLTKSYQHTQSLELLLDAKEDPCFPFFLIL